jgi:uncharacterized protein
VFDLRTVRLAVGGHHRETHDVSIPPFTLAGVEYEADPATIPADFAVTRLRSGFVFALRFDVHLTGPCHRCLEPAHVHEEIRAEEYHAFNPDPGAEADMTCEYLDDDRVDTDRWASDAAVLAMPFQVLCRQDCLGLCVGCGADLNEGPCDCVTTVEDARWARLRDLQIRSEERGPAA